MYLPLAFQENMKNLLADEWQELEKALQEPPLHGLRVNTLKIAVEDFLKKAPFKLESIPWSRDGFYISKDERPGKHAYYSAGLYYIQEPSAMLPAEVLNAQPGERILDMCAAPGGKSAQIAAQLQGQGVLVSNDINSERTKPLAKNLALLGVQNAVILNESPDRIAQKFQGWFDGVLVDAPCSGEGMFRRDEQAPKSWEAYGPACCIPLQQDILEEAAKLLKPGGRMVYSTCTFTPQENEKAIVSFLSEHPDFELVPIKKSAGLENGRPEWGDHKEELSCTLRAWPHRAKGEGHFVALLRKNLASQSKEPKLWRNAIPKELPLWEEFSQNTLKAVFTGKLITFAEHLYLTYPEIPDLTGLKVVRPGFYLGEFKKNRFEPSHALALALTSGDVKQTVDFAADDISIEKYFKGETLTAEILNGWTLITVEGFGIGWAKAVNGILKNHYPKGWRKQ